MNAIRFRKNDRVPVDTPIGYFPARVAGIQCAAQLDRRGQAGEPAGDD